MSEQVEGRPLAESLLIESARKGDQAAYGELVRAHQDIARRVAYLVLRRHNDVDDVVQMAFVKAFRALDRFRPGSDFRPWILRIVRNEALNQARGSGRRDRLALKVANASGGAAPSPEAMVVEAERRKEVLTALDDLPNSLRDVVECRFLLGLSEATTASLLRIPAGTVKSRTSRAMERLRAILAESDL
ncbi:MAG TPA: RNA polymerase sigma factor [Acidimicrobiia bacterium]|nr:RNA polymerase sigma factor [Acidimicrobiia bacterium]